MKNKKLLSIIGTATGVCMLATAAFANYQISNGYDSLKKSIFNMPNQTNYTVDASISFNADGNVLEETHVYQEADEANKLMYAKSNGLSKGSEYENEHWSTKDLEYDGNNHDGFTVYPSYRDNYSLFPLNFASDEKTNKKVMRFLELLADTFVGDLKNNFICVESNDEESVYEVNLTSIQIPEVVNAGLSAMFSLEMSNEYADYEPSEAEKALLQLGTDPYVSKINCRFTTGNDNTLRNIDANFTLTGTNEKGEEHSIDVKGSAAITNIGTTVIKPIDFSTLNIVHDFSAEDESANTYIETKSDIETESED